MQTVDKEMRVTTKEAENNLEKIILDYAKKEKMTFENIRNVVKGVRVHMKRNAILIDEDPKK